MGYIWSVRVGLHVSAHLTAHVGLLPTHLPAPLTCPHPPQVRLRQKLTGATDAVKSFFTGKAAGPDPAVEKLNELKVSVWGCSYASSGEGGGAA